MGYPLFLAGEWTPMIGPGGCSPGARGPPADGVEKGETVGVGAGVGVGTRPPPGGTPPPAVVRGAPAAVMRPHLSELVIGSFQSLRSVRGRVSNISLSVFG